MTITLSSKENKTNIEKKSLKDKPRYTKPVLQDLGDLRTLTLGPSPGVSDVSGGWPSNSSYPP